MHQTLHAASAKLHQGHLSPVDCLESCLAQIARLEGRVRAWVLVDRERARREAERAEAEIRGGAWRGPLHGIPFAIKDVFDVFDWPTAAGSRLWANSVARHDATVVQRLRQAGAVLMGKTVTTQYASFDPPVTTNPWNRECTPGGSSSGSAAAVASGMCLGALGSQTGGSITRPASFCGVAGCKPTYGRVSCAGVVPLAGSMDHPGPMGLCVRDLALILQAIAGPDPLDSGCENRPVPDFQATLTGPLPAPRLGRLRGLFEELAEPVMKENLEKTVEKLRAGGAEIVDVALPAAFAEVIARHRVVMAVEAAAFHRFRLQRHPEDYQPRFRELLEEGLNCPAPEYAACKAHQQALSRAMLACFEGVDALLTPATTGPAPDAGTTGNPAFNSPWSYTGLPTASFPMAWTADRMPLAVQLVGEPWSEARLFRAAAWGEDTLAVERPVLPT